MEPSVKKAPSREEGLSALVEEVCVVRLVPRGVAPVPLDEGLVHPNGVDCLGQGGQELRQGCREERVLRPILESARDDALRDAVPERLCLRGGALPHPVEERVAEQAAERADVPYVVASRREPRVGPEAAGEN